MVNQGVVTNPKPISLIDMETTKMLFVGTNYSKKINKKKNF